MLKYTSGVPISAPRGGGKVGAIAPMPAPKQPAHEHPLKFWNPLAGSPIQPTNQVCVYVSGVGRGKLYVCHGISVCCGMYTYTADVEGVFVYMRVGCLCSRRYIAVGMCIRMHIHVCTDVAVGMCIGMHIHICTDGEGGMRIHENEYWCIYHSILPLWVVCCISM